MKIADVARQLNKGEQYIRICLQRGLFPFGTATKIPGSSRWNYVIFPEKFREYVGEVKEG